MSDKPIVTGPAPMVICPTCGPTNVMYAGRVLYQQCKRCAALLKLLAE